VVATKLPNESFRHTFRTLLDESGASMKAQQELKRRADIRTTMNVYGKAVDESKREAHGKVVRLVLPSKVAQCPFVPFEVVAIGLKRRKLVEPMGFEPTTSSMPSRRAPNCATAPPYELVKFTIFFKGFSCRDANRSRGDHRLVRECKWERKACWRRERERPRSTTAPTTRVAS
jgi:hypothetical protein